MRPGQFSFDVGCYVIKDGCDVKCVHLECFADFYPLGIYKIGDNNLVILKHQPVDID